MTLTIPPSFDGVLDNFGSGWMSTQKAADGSEPFPCRTAYIKYYASELVKSDGSYDFSKPILDLGRCAAAGQRMLTRLAVYEPTIAPPPAWGAKMRMLTYTTPEAAGNKIAPDYSDPRAVGEILHLLQAFGAAISRHSALEGVDVGLYGLWGEQHNSGTKLASGLEMPLPTSAVKQQFLDALIAAFPTQFLFSCLEDSFAVEYLTSRGYGIGQDGVGNPKHDTTFIPTWTAAGKAENAWMTHPARFEIYSNFAGWVANAWDFDERFDFLRRIHCSYLHTKGFSIPVGKEASVKNFLARTGFRPSIATLAQFGDQVFVGLENDGSAPYYHPLVLSLTVAGKTTEQQLPPIFPGQKIQVSFKVAAPGAASLQLKEYYPGAVLQLAHVGNADRSYDIGTIEAFAPPPPPPETLESVGYKFIDLLVHS